MASKFYAKFFEHSLFLKTYQRLLQNNSSNMLPMKLCVCAATICSPSQSKFVTPFLIEPIQSEG